MLPRVLEPEVMDSPEEADDYDAMDHAQVNAAFCDDLLRARSDLRRVLDVGTGTARIPILLCERHGSVEVVAIDLAESMLAVAARNVERAGLAARIALRRADAKDSSLGAGAFDAVVSNSIVHHIPSPGDVLVEMWRLLAPGGLLFVRDLARPRDAAELARLVDAYAALPAGASGAALEMHSRQRELFGMSLHAALTVDEVRALASPLGVASSSVAMTSDRHWTLSCVKPARA
jgi:ubiquinone/menaquinone biosynthesis C-methylase UbiE